MLEYYYYFSKKKKKKKKKRAVNETVRKVYDKVNQIVWVRKNYVYRSQCASLLLQMTILLLHLHTIKLPLREVTDQIMRGPLPLPPNFDYNKYSAFRTSQKQSPLISD